MIRKNTLLQNKDVLQKTLDQIVTLIESVMDPTVTGIGIGVPSVVDIDAGKVYDVFLSRWLEMEY